MIFFYFKDYKIKNKIRQRKKCWQIAARSLTRNSPPSLKRKIHGIVRIYHTGSAFTQQYYVWRVRSSLFDIKIWIVRLLNKRRTVIAWFVIHIIFGCISIYHLFYNKSNKQKCTDQQKNVLKIQHHFNFHVLSLNCIKKFHSLPTSNPRIKLHRCQNHWLKLKSNKVKDNKNDLYCCYEDGCLSVISNVG